MAAARMTDYGLRRARGEDLRGWRDRLGRAAEVAALAGLLLMLASIPGWIVYSGWAELQAMKAAWTIAGPACPIVEQPSRSVVGKKPPKPFSYGGIHFVRQFGHVSCVGWDDGGLGGEDITRVCQFSGPAMVKVAIAGRTVIYQPGVGRRATVTVRHGRPSCVVGGWFGY
jgi:hypothetical protein